MQMCKNVVFIRWLLKPINHELNMRENRPRSREMLAVLFRYCELFFSFFVVDYKNSRGGAAYLLNF